MVSWYCSILQERRQGGWKIAEERESFGVKNEGEVYAHIGWQWVRRNKEDRQGVSAGTTTMPVLFYAPCVGDPLVRINCVEPDRPRWPNSRLKLSIDTSHTVSPLLPYTCVLCVSQPTRFLNSCNCQRGKKKYEIFLWDILYLKSTFYQNLLNISSIICPSHLFSRFSRSFGVFWIIG